MATQTSSDDDSIPKPPKFQQSMKLFKPLGVRLRKTDSSVTTVRPLSNASNCVYAGDKVVKIDGIHMPDHQHIQEIMALKTPKAVVTIERDTFSLCEHLCTTIEVVRVPKNKLKSTGRAIDLFNIFWHCKNALRVASLEQIVGASIRYDYRERVQIADLDPGGLAAVHLQLGDVILELNNIPIASKTMTNYYMKKFLGESGYLQMKLKVERSVNNNVDAAEQALTSADVVEIGEKQLKQFQETRLSSSSSSLLKSSPMIPTVGQKPAKKLSATISANQPKTIDIQSDYEPSELKPCSKDSD